MRNWYTQDLKPFRIHSVHEVKSASLYTWSARDVAEFGNLESCVAIAKSHLLLKPELRIADQSSSVELLISPTSKTLDLTLH